jgi:anhydro-N-acetylmuramic acid kinase
MSEHELYIGVMSGTSLDGVDCALVSFESEQINLLESHFFPMPSKLKRSILAICTGQPTDLKTIGELDHKLGHLFADAVLALLEQSSYRAEDIRAIGSHGQTVFHQPTGDTPFTIQLGDSHIIAEKTAIDTVADFRRKDMALGGQGAPLVPAFHKTLFNSGDSSLVILNIGGIANISVINPDSPVIGYDTGPGNVLMDSWCHLHTQQDFDKNAAMARKGKPHALLLNQMKQSRYFAQPAPKSTGRELFNIEWLEKQLRALNQRISADDVQHSLCCLTADTIAEQVALHRRGDKPQLLVCGGGAQNPLLIEKLTSALPDWIVATTSSRGVDSDYMEAMAFAWLAKQRIHHLPSNLPQVTGAKRAASLGVIYAAN